MILFSVVPLLLCVVAIILVDDKLSSTGFSNFND